MADVQPLRGLHYNLEKIKDLAQVVTPPFDVISPAAQARYYERHPSNIIRLELGQQYATDNSINNVYTRAAKTLAEWRLEDILKQEEQPCYYLYQQHFSYGDQHYTRTGLLARVRLEPWDARVVLPHEHIRTKDKEDRLNLLRACSTNLSPIMCMYEDPQGRIRRLLQEYEQDPQIQVIDEQGEQHLLTPINNPEQIALIHSFFEQRQLYIADGHHRYTTALQYREEMLAQRKELDAQDGINFVMMSLIDVDDPGWLVLPTHRILFHLSPDQLTQITPDGLKSSFTVRSLDETLTEKALQQELSHAAQTAPSFILKTADQTLLLTINAEGRQRMSQSGHSTAWNELDVAILQTLILEDRLKLTAAEIAAGTNIRYSHDTTETLSALQQSEAQAVLLLTGIDLRLVCAVAQADDRMPQKSTYLYPKLITGLVMNPLW